MFTILITDNVSSLQIMETLTTFCVSPVWNSNLTWYTDDPGYVNTGCGVFKRGGQN